MKKLLLIALLSAPIVAQVDIREAEQVLHHMGDAVFADTVQTKEQAIEAIKRLYEADIFGSTAACIEMQKQNIKEMKAVCDCLAELEEKTDEECQAQKELEWHIKRMEVVLQVFEEAFAHQA